MTNKVFQTYRDETDLNIAKITYERALKNNGYQTTLKLKKPSQNLRRNQNRKMIWFNSPFSLNVTINIGKEFFKLIRKDFTRNHSFRKIFNLNTINE